MNVYTDNRWNRVVSSWNRFPFEDFLYGKAIMDGVAGRRIGTSAKVELTPQLAGDFIPVESKDVPLAWFAKDVYKLIQSENRIRFMAISGYDVLGKPKYRIIKGDEIGFCQKLLLLARTSRSREFWAARIPTLIAYPNYAINCVINAVDDFVAPPLYRFGIKEEHAIDGFYKIWAQDSLNTVYEDGSVWCFEEPKKAIARDSRLVDVNTAIPYGKHRIVVLEDVSDPEIRDWFVTGSCYVPMNWIKTRGPSRIISKYGLKATTAPMPEAMESIFGDAIVVSKASWKTGFNGIVAMLTGRSPADMTGLNDLDVQLILACSNAKRYYNINDVDVIGWELQDVPVMATNIYSLYSLRTVTEEDDEDIKDEESSFYLEAVAEIRKDPSFDLVGHIFESIAAGKVRYHNRGLNLKSMEFVVADFSYGREISTEWMRKVVGEGSVRHGEIFDMMSGVHNHTQMTMVDIKKLIDTVFKGVKINPGSFDPEKLQSSGGVRIPQEEAEKRLDVLLHGDGFEWEGLLAGNSKMIEISGHHFYIPGPSIMKDFIYKEEGSNRFFFSGPVSQFLLLLVSARHKNTKWNLKWINHSASMQRALLGENIDQFRVEGANLVLLPGPWLDKDQVAYVNKKTGITGRVLKAANGDRVTFSKMPVLFNKAVADVHLLTGLPKYLYGDQMDDRFTLAMRNMMFCNTELLLVHQNDTDGDTGRISLTGGILPVFDGMPKYMDNWVDTYKQDEYDLKIKFKSYKQYDIELMDVAVREAVFNKGYIGRGTNDLMAWSSTLQVYVSYTQDTEFEATEARDGYAMELQNTIRGVKHDSGSNLLRDAAYVNMFIDQKKDMFWTAIAQIVEKNIGKQIDFTGMRQWVESHMTLPTSTPGKNYSPMAYLRTRRTSDIRLQKFHGEDCFKTLNAFTNSFIIGVEAAMPSFRTTDAKAKQVSNMILTNETAFHYYCDKHILLGQDIRQYIDPTTHGELLDIIYNRNNHISVELNMEAEDAEHQA